MSYTKYLRWVVVGGLFASLFIPFIVATGAGFPAMFFPYITGKNFTFRIIVEIIFLAYVLLAVKDPAYRPRPSLLLWSVGAFIAWMALATGLSVDPIKSFWSNFERMDGYITLIHLCALFIVAGSVLTATNLWKRFFQWSVAASAVMGSYAVLQLAHVMTISSQSGARVDTSFGNATYLAVYMLFNSFITIFLALDIVKGGVQAMRRSSVALTLYGITLLLDLVALYYTQTRGSILGLVVGIIVAAIYVALFAKQPEWKVLRKTSFAGLGIILILLGMFFALRQSSFIQHSQTLSRFANISLTDRTTQSRFLIWGMVYQGFKEKPVFGWGQENFNYVFNKYYNPAMFDQEQWFDRAHNEFFDWLIAGGLPAFLLYISLFALAVWSFLRSDALSVPQKGILIGLLAGYAFNNLLVFDNLMSIVYFFLILAFAHSLSRKSLPGWMFLSKPASDRTLAVVAPVALILIGGAGIFFNANGIARAETLIVALSSSDAQQSFDAFKMSVASGYSLGYQEAVEQFFQFASNRIAVSTAVSPDLKQQVFAATQDAGNTLLAARPHDARLELFMGVFYSQFGQSDQSLKYLQMAAADSPSKQQILFQTGITELQRGDSAGGLAMLKKAYDIEPAYNDSAVFYAIGLNYAGQKAQADTLLTQKFGSVLYDDERLLQAYVNTKQWDRVVAIWSARVDKSPTDANVHMGLAQAYFASGNKTKTLAELELIAKLNPAAASQIESLITQIKNGTLKTPQ